MSEPMAIKVSWGTGSSPALFQAIMPFGTLDIHN